MYLYSHQNHGNNHNQEENGTQIIIIKACVGHFEG